ncbi:MULTISPECIES: transglutaminase-like cysteine peptidase [Alkalimonas]|uniref:Transglutaminase-like cysteine peptidase n=1 Tax=Alkalimonas mucilaginosa TaxID=3057676 RepID=A0ABU7JG59_9GAMM|nr:transglutaminase-like cysteine peptidase [Alkalimonas sp. MEB004]MEE2024485.1 transglutaminase-like cysteine peptidase [Alkalimonas sp. MEB004]
MPAKVAVRWLFSTAALLLLLLCASSGWSTLEHFRITDSMLRSVEERYGRAGRFRVERWQRLLDQHRQSDIHTMLQAVNRFANDTVGYASDLEHWGQNDYWATPLETLGTGKGDCEDYVILKYASLRALGVPEERLRLMYVRALSIDEPHMVLIYFEEPDQFPLVLDNLTNRILPANERTDLRPVYSFNGQGLWMARAQGLGQKVPNSPGVRDWTVLLERIERGE